MVISRLAISERTINIYSNKDAIGWRCNEIIWSLRWLAKILRRFVCKSNGMPFTDNIKY